MGVVDNLLSAGAGAAVGVGLTYALNVRIKRRDVETDAVALLEEALTEMQVHALNHEPPWEVRGYERLRDDGQRAIARARPRLDERQSEIVRRAQRAVAMFDVGARTSRADAENFAVCFGAYVGAAFEATAAFYARERAGPSTLPSGREILQSAAADPTLASLRERVES
jgi:hypothetical protein